MKEYPKEVYDFEDYLNDNNIEYHLEGDTFVITYKGDLDIIGIDNLPDNIDLRNDGHVYIEFIKRSPENIKFNNNGDVSLHSLKKLSESIEFNNSGTVIISYIEEITKNIKFNNKGDVWLYSVKYLPDNKYEIFKNDGIVYYDTYIKQFDPRKGLESKLSFKEYPKEVYDFEDYLNKRNIEYHLEGDTFVITHKGNLIFDDIKYIPDNIDFRNDGFVSFVYIKQLSENIRFNNNGNVVLYSLENIPENTKFNNNGFISFYFLKEIPKNITFNNNGDIYLYSVKDLPDNKYEIFKNDGVVYYNKERKKFDPRKGLKSKLSFKEYPKEVYDFEEYLNKNNIEYRLEGDTFVITHKGYLIISGINNLPDNIDFRNDGFVSVVYAKHLPDNIRFNNNGNVDLYSLEDIPKNITFNNKGDIYLDYIKYLPNNKYEIFKNDGVVYYNHGKSFIPKDKLENKISFKEYPKEVYDFEEYLNKYNIEYHLEGDTFVITHKGNLIIGIDNFPDNIDFRNNGYVDLISIKYLPDNIRFNNNGYVNLYNLKEITKNITFNNNGNTYLYSVKDLPDNKYEIFKNDGIVSYDRHAKRFDPREGLESKLSFKEYPKEVYDFEEYLNKYNIEYYLEGDTFVITHKGSLGLANIDNLPENIDFRNDGDIASISIKCIPKNIKFNNNGIVSFPFLKKLSENIEFNNNGYVTISYIKEIPENIKFNNNGDVFTDIIVDIPNRVKFNNKGNVWLYSVKDLPDNKYEIFKNDGIVYYDKERKEFDPRKGLEDKLSFKEYPKEVYDFEDYLNKYNIEYHLEGDTFVITHKGSLYITHIENIPENIDFRNDGNVSTVFIKRLPNNIKFNNNGDVFTDIIVDIPNSVKFNNKGNVWLYSVKDLPDNKYEIFKNDGIVYYDKERKEFDPRKGLESKLSFKEYPKEVYDFEEYLNDNNIEYHLEGDTFVITHKGDLIIGIDNLPENIDFRNDGYVDIIGVKYLPNNIKFNNNGYVSFPFLKKLSDSIEFNNSGDVDLYSLEYIPKSTKFNNKGNVWLYSVKDLPDNKYEIFKNDGIVYYDENIKKFDPRKGLESKLSFKEYPKEVYDFEDYLNKHNIEYHLEGDTFVITHKGKLIFNDIKHIPKDIDFRNDGYVDFVFVKQLSENTKFNNNGNVFIDNIVGIPNNVKFNNNGKVSLYSLKKLLESVEFNNSGDVTSSSIKEIPKNIKFNNKGDVWLYSVKDLPDNKYEIFKNDGIVYYNKYTKWFDPRKGLENKLSFKEYPKEVYDFEDYLNDNNI